MAGVDLEAASPGSRVASRPGARRGGPGGERSARTSAWMRWSSVRAGARLCRWSSWQLVARGETSCISRASWAPGGQQRLRASVAGRVIGAPGPGPPRPARRRGPTAPATGGAETGGPLARPPGPQHLQVAGGQAGQAEQRHAPRAGRRPMGSAGAGRRLRQPLGRAGLADPGREPPPQLRLPGARAPVRGWRGRPAAPRPRRAASRAGARRSGRTDRRCGGRWRSAGPAAGRLGPAPLAQVGGQVGQPRLGQASSTTSSSGHTARSGSQGSLSPLDAGGRGHRAPTSLPGNGKSMLAHTPSPRPAAAPRRAESCWVSHARCHGSAPRSFGPWGPRGAPPAPRPAPSPGRRLARLGGGATRRVLQVPRRVWREAVTGTQKESSRVAP